MLRKSTLLLLCGRRANSCLEPLSQIYKSDPYVLSQERAYGHDPIVVKNQALKKGPGGRSSVSGLTATVFGATGFLGRYVINALAQKGTQVIIPYRCDDLDMQHLRQMGDLGQMVFLPNFDIDDKDQIKYAISRSNIVINLIGALIPTWNYSFRNTHVDIATKMAEVVARSPLVERFIHISALGADTTATSERLRTKGEGDMMIKQIYPQATILKPGYMIGSEDRFYNTIATLGKSLPFVPVIDGGRTRVQPVYVRDVTAALIEALKNAETIGNTYHLGGPEVYTMRQIAEMIFYNMRETCHIMPYPSALGKASVICHTLFHKSLPLHFMSHMLTADFIDELSDDIVIPRNVMGFKDLGMIPQNVTKGICIEHVRFWRAGGYDFGTTAGTQ